MKYTKRAEDKKYGKEEIRKSRKKKQKASYVGSVLAAPKGEGEILNRCTTTAHPTKVPLYWLSAYTLRITAVREAGGCDFLTYD
jgi:hypothetical protein